VRLRHPRPRPRPLPRRASTSTPGTPRRARRRTAATRAWDTSRPRGAECRPARATTASLGRGHNVIARKRKEHPADVESTSNHPRVQIVLVFWCPEGETCKNRRAYTLAHPKRPPPRRFSPVASCPFSFTSSASLSAPLLTRNSPKSPRRLRRGSSSGSAAVGASAAPLKQLHLRHVLSASRALRNLSAPMRVTQHLAEHPSGLRSACCHTLSATK